MSSHHIVRENQEPALIIIDVDALDIELLGQLLEWSPIVITTEENTDFLLAHGIKIDAIISEKDPHEDSHQAHIEYIIPVPEKETVICAALRYLITRRQFTYYIMKNVVNHSFFDGLGDVLQVTVFSNNIRYVRISHFEKWFPKEQILTIDAKNQLITSNITQIENGTYQVNQDGFVHISSQPNELIIIGEKL